jgi:hypothetical protein
VTKIEITPKYSEVKPQGYYVYVHKRATNGTPFYVGKGKGRRAWDRSKSDCRSDHWINCALKNGVIVDVICDGMDEKSAYKMEADVISSFRSECIDLVNQSEGGIGPIGLVVSEATKEKISSAFQFKVWNDDGEEFRNTCAAAREMRNRGYPRAAASGIFAAIKGEKSKTAYGYAWSNICVPDKPKSTGYHASNEGKMLPVLCVDTGMKFVSCSEAARWVASVGRPSARGYRISSCAKGESMTAYGMKWRSLESE